MLFAVLFSARPFLMLFHVFQNAGVSCHDQDTR